MDRTLCWAVADMLGTSLRYSGGFVQVPVKVAVFGSCVTRDNFNRTFNPGYKDLFECVALADHVSLVSLMSPPVAVESAELDGLQPRILANLRREFCRAFLDELRQTMPKYLVMDFWPDLVFGFVDLADGGTVTHNSWSTVKTSFFEKRGGQQVRAGGGPASFFERWQRAADEFMTFMKQELPETRVIIHSARNVGHWVSADGASKAFSPWATAVNGHWEAMDRYLIEHHGCRTIDVLVSGQTSFETHPWGPFPVHYTFDYHQRFLSRLSRVVMEDA